MNTTETAQKIWVSCIQDSHYDRDYAHILACELADNLMVTEAQHQKVLNKIYQLAWGEDDE